MSLENPTKINYGNVDDITSTEINNVGKNLDALGQKVQKVVDDVWTTTNADHDGANWNRLDTAKAATAIKIGVDGSITHYTTAAGANPIVWVEAFKIDPTGTISGVIIPLAQMQGPSEIITNWDFPSLISQGSSWKTVTMPGANMGDYVLVSADEDFPDGFILSARITGANAVKITMTNTSVNTQNPPNANYRTRIIKAET